MFFQTGYNNADQHFQSSSSSSSIVSSTVPSFIQTQSSIGPPSIISSLTSTSITPPIKDVDSYVESIQDSLKEGWTVHTAKDGRLYYCNHITKSAGWLPPIENWGHNIDLPYGWEQAILAGENGRSYFINHINKTTTYEKPQRFEDDDPPPEPRRVVLERNPQFGFGFVAGSEKPVIVRFVTEGGPSEGKLEPGDEILAINDEDVKNAPRDHVIQLIRNCESKVELLVCQPKLTNTGCGRKSTLLSAAKKNKLKSRPIRVRFAESVCVNGAPLFPPSAFSLGDILIPPMANVLKVFLENGQTKSFKYDSTTTVQDVVSSLLDKLCITANEHFSLVLEHVKSLKRNKLSLLDPLETVARIASRPGAHKLRCLFRVTFVPVTAAELAQKDLNALDYLFMQSCNDVIQERFAPELQPDVTLRLAALHMHQHALANNISPAKLTVKTVEREFGLERFVPTSLIDGMKRKELRRLISHFLKLNSQMTGSTKILTQLQAKIHYLDIISGLPSYGAKCFSTNQRDGVEHVLLISPRFGLSQITGIKSSIPQSICTIEELSRVVVSREDDVSCSVTVYITPDKKVLFSMDDQDAKEFAIVLAGYYRLIAGKNLYTECDKQIIIEDVAPPYLSQHTVVSAGWNYIPDEKTVHSMAFLMPPPYHSTKQLLLTCSKIHNNNNDELMVNKNLMSTHKYKDQSDCDDFGFDLHSIVSMEILENQDNYKNTLRKDPKQKLTTFVEAKNQEVLKRVAEMKKMIENSQRYLNENDGYYDDNNTTANNILTSDDLKHFKESSVDSESDNESVKSNMQTVANRETTASATPPPGILKHSDSLILLAETISQDLNGINKGLNSIFTSCSNEEKPHTSATNTPKSERRVHSLSQIINDLQSLGGNDLSQSESESESFYTPNSSPNRKTQQNEDGLNCLNDLSSKQKKNSQMKPINKIRTSFGLHSPDALADTEDSNLKEYLKHLKQASNHNSGNNQDLAAEKIAEIYGFELGDDSMIETDPDLIDLTTIPPPQTPDELDIPPVINQAPTGFDDVDGNNAKSTKANEGDLEEFLKKVTIEPPTSVLTPAVELTPEEIMSFIIPPPPATDDSKPTIKNVIQKPPNNICPPARPTVLKPRHIDNCNSVYDNHPNDLYSNSQNICTESPQRFSNNGNNNSVKSKIEIFNNQSQVNNISSCTLPIRPKVNRVIEYSTVDRKMPWNCCAKENKPKQETSVSDETDDNNKTLLLKLPPRQSPHCHNNNYNIPVPERPPKSVDLKFKFSSPVQIQYNNINNQSLYNNTTTDNKFNNASSFNGPPSLPPRINSPEIVKKPPLPPVPHKPFQTVAPLIQSPKKISNNINNNNQLYSTCKKNQTPSPLMIQRNPFVVQDLNLALNVQQQQKTSNNNESHLQYLCSPQLSRKTAHNHHHHQLTQQSSSVPGSPILSHKNGHIINVENLLAKTNVAMSGLLIKLDQIAIQCSNAQQAGGGTDIDEEKFQATKNELIEQTLQLVTASKLLVITMSDSCVKNLPEHLTSCLTALRRITELAQDLVRYTSAPLQTRNIVLKIHDVSSSFRELVCVQVGPLGQAQLALSANCLANVLSTLLRSLRVFSP